MKQVFIATGLLLAFVSFGYAQTEYPSPQGCVQITREAALKALADSDRVKALEAELKVKDQAYADQKELLHRMRIEFAEKAGENTALRQNAISDRAIIDLLLKHVRPKKIGIINF